MQTGSHSSGIKSDSEPGARGLKAESCHVHHAGAFAGLTHKGHKLLHLPLASSQLDESRRLAFHRSFTAHADVHRATASRCWARAASAQP
ncbi:hypothetical protein WJX73_004827 [Symbiochloris irregularis]|uniref:Uncharacterized protein n=1 Tax=Symbiochloris irregularis TaxID=706552 RepID=A0AAW1P0P6_9CHLO